MAASNVPIRFAMAFSAMVFLANSNLSAQSEKTIVPTYQSPYLVKFQIPFDSLTADFKSAPRNDGHLESSVPFADWYSGKIREKYGVWGPPQREFPPPEGIAGQSAEWKRERVIAAGLKWQGYGYQHHHVPDWEPPANWPWKQTKSGHNGRGVDCSNFTALAYNYGLGIKFTSDVKHQADLKDVSGAAGKKSIHFESDRETQGLRRTRQSTEGR